MFKKSNLELKGSLLVMGVINNRDKTDADLIVTSHKCTRLKGKHLAAPSNHPSVLLKRTLWIILQKTWE